MNREDFSFLDKDIIYFDSAATSLKPKILIDSLNDYYSNYPSNIHRGDYSISLKADSMFENTREIVKDFIGANIKEQIVC